MHINQCICQEVRIHHHSDHVKNAIRQENQEELRWLLGQRIDLNARLDSQGNTPLTFAIKSGHPTIARLLVNHGADINHPGASQRTPLMEAIRKQDIGLVGFLIAHGANVNAKNRSGNTPLKEALHVKNRDIERLLRAHGATSI